MSRRIAVALITFAVLLPACGGISAAERSAVETYTTTIGPHAREGGRVVVQGIRPGLSDLSFGRISGEEFRGRAPGWKSSLEAARKGFADAPVPPRLARAAATFDDAFEGYLRAVDAFVQASFKEGDARKDAITGAVPVAEAADKTYDRAIEMLKAERERVGLPETTEL